MNNDLEDNDLDILASLNLPKDRSMAAAEYLSRQWPDTRKELDEKLAEQFAEEKAMAKAEEKFFFLPDRPRVEESLYKHEILGKLVTNPLRNRIVPVSQRRKGGRKLRKTRRRHHRRRTYRRRR